MIFLSVYLLFIGPISPIGPIGPIKTRTEQSTSSEFGCSSQIRKSEQPGGQNHCDI